MKNELIERAREFVNAYVKTLPLPVQLNGITEKEKNEAASICAEFASNEIRAERQRILTCLERMHDDEDYTSLTLQYFIDDLRE